MVLAPLTALTIPLVEDLRVEASGDDTLIHLGLVPVDGSDTNGVMVAVSVRKAVGRGGLTPGVRWPDATEPVWFEKELVWEDAAFMVPLYPEGPGRVMMGVWLRLRARAPSRRCSGRVDAVMQVPLPGR